METSFNKKSILKNTFQVGFNTLLSRLLGLAREIFLMRYLGIGIVADAFSTAFMLPNSLRKIFAEGALTSAFVPTLVSVFKDGSKEKASQLTTVALIVFESILLIFCSIVMLKAAAVVKFIAPGYSKEQIDATIPCLQILMPFIFFISTSSLMAGALQLVNHFFVPSFSPVILNIGFIVALIICQMKNLNVKWLCFAILFTGLIQCLMHIFVYFKYGFKFSGWDRKTIKSFLHVIAKFMLCFIGMSVMEINLFIDQQFASYLSVGSVTLIKYASRFMGIPLGIFAVAFSTILLPHFSNLGKNHEKINFYVFESIKFILWVTIPATIIICFLSQEIFFTLFVSMSNNFPQDRVAEAGYILAGFLSGLCFFSLNKILFNLFYSFHDTFYPTIISIIATLSNILMNYALIGHFQSIGLAIATSISGLIQMILCFYFLNKKHDIQFQTSKIIIFLIKYIFQISIFIIPFYFFYNLILKLLNNSYFFVKSIGFWFWVTPIICLFFLSLLLFRKIFKIDLYFIE